MAQNTSNNPSFSPDQRQRLTNLGLRTVEINELEIYLPLCRALLGPTPKFQEVRDAIESLHRKMKSAHSAMAELRTATLSMAAKYEANARLIIADERGHRAAEGGDIERAMQALESACSVVQRAQESLPKVQRRHRKADIAPVQFINKALLDGFNKRHSTNSTDPVTGERRFGPLPPYTLKQSSSANSPYRRIVGICYEAIDQNLDPERAIKAFIAWRKCTDEEGRQAFGIKPSVSRTRRHGGTVGTAEGKKN